MSLGKRYLFGMLSGAGSVVIKTGLNILLIPVLISRLGLDSFGLYILLISILEVSTLLDLGATGAMVSLLGGETANSLSRRAFLKVGHLWFALLSAIFLLVGIALLPQFNHLFHLTPALQLISRECFLIILLEASLTIYSYYAYSILLSHCSHQWTNLADTLGALLANGGAIVLLFAGFGLPEVLGLRLVASLLRMGIMIWHTYKLEAFAFCPKAPFSLSVLKKMAALSGHAMMLNFCIIISHKVDDIVIARFLPISAVGVYEIVFRFLGITLQICLKICEGVYPLFSKMAAANQHEDARALFLRMSCLINFVAAMILMLIVSYYRELFHVFSAGKIPIEQTLPILALAIPCILSGALQMPANAWLFSWGHQRYLTTSSILAAVSNLILSLILVQYFGLLGVALGTLIPQLIQHQASLIFKTCQELHISFLQYFKAVHGAIFVPLLVSLLWVQALRPFLSVTPFKLLPIGVISAAAFLIGSFLWFRLTATPIEMQLFKEIYQLKIRQPIQRLLKKDLSVDKTVDNAS